VTEIFNGEKSGLKIGRMLSIAQKDAEEGKKNNLIDLFFAKI